MQAMQLQNMQEMPNDTLTAHSLPFDLYLLGSLTYHHNFQINIILGMHIATEYNLPTVPIQKNNESFKSQEQGQYDHREYRYLLSVFAENINILNKQNRDCLGEMEYCPRQKISREEQDMCETNLLEIYQKYKAKISKESVYRNTIIKKACETYLNQYEKSVLLPRRNDLPSMFLLKKLSLIQKKSQPFSIRPQMRKATSMGSAHQKLLVLSQTFKAFQAQTASTGLKVKTFSSDSVQAKDYFLKSGRSNMSRTERIRLKSDMNFLNMKKRSSMQRGNETQNCQDVIFRGNQILISDHRKDAKTDQWEYQKQAPLHNKFCTRRVVAIGQPQRKVINDIELLHLQTKQLRNNNIFISPLENSSFYKPKSKRWQNAIS